MEDPDEGDGGSFDATPTVQPVLLQSADLQVDEVGEPEDQYILLSSTHPDLQENQATGSELAFYMDIEDNPASEQYVYVPGTSYDAKESVAHAAIQCLQKKKNIADEDINYNSLICTEKKFHTTKQMLDLFAHGLQLQRNEGHLLQLKYNKLVHKITKICAQSTSYLPIHVNGSDNQHGQTNDITVTYTGRSPPITSNEIFAKKLIALMRFKRDQSSSFPHRQILFSQSLKFGWFDSLYDHAYLCPPNLKGSESFGWSGAVEQKTQLHP
uniref:Uncharacterized protein n=1 Tax=Oryza glumipatula TaxID=40148 RepID=A0A0E0AZD6_9ORYZ